MYRTIRAGKPFAGALTLCLTLAAIALSAAGVLAAGTPVGTPITNQAKVTYSDSNNVDQTPVTSNVVTTTVAQKYSVDVATANSPQTTLPGTTVYYPIKVTNTGNGPESYDFTQTNTGIGGAANRTIYADLNNNGVVDPGEPAVTATGVMQADQTRNFIFALVVPPTAVSGNTDTTTTTVADGTNATGSVADRTDVTTGAVIAVSKAAVPASGASYLDPLGSDTARTVNYTINFTNTGQAAASNLWVEDALPTSPTGNQVTGTPSASPTGAVYGYTGGAWEAFDAAHIASYTKVGYLLSSLGVGASGSFSFSVKIAPSVAPGTITNTATVKLGVTAPGTGGTQAASTNPVTTTIRQTASVTISAQALPAPSASPGGSVTVSHIVKNTGNGSDTFNLSLALGTLPAGSTVRFLNSDGTTAVADTNGDGIPDSGVLAAGGEFTFAVVITLPITGATAGTDSFSVTATSVLDSSKSATAADQLTVNANPSITGFTKTVAPASAKPGATVTYTINYTVSGATANNVVITDVLPANLTLGTVNDGGTAAAGVITWTIPTAAPGPHLVSFTAIVNAGVASGATITNKVNLTYQNAAGTPMTPPTEASADLTVATKAGLTLTPNNQANAAPGATQLYGHVITNSGNASDTVTLSAVSPNGWQYTFFADAGNGVPGAQITSLTVPAGQSLPFLVRVQVPAGAVAGAKDVAVITGTSGNDTHPTASATDSTTVIAVASPNLSVSKSVSVVGGGQAIPGATLLYTVVVTNSGTGAAKNVVVTDAVPANTTYVDGSATVTLGSAIETSGVLTWNVATGATTLDAGASATFTFKVTIN